MLHKNLTPFFWGPKVTSRYPPQVEMAVCVRGVFRLEPGAPLEAIEEEMEQGFMSGDVFDPDDIAQLGALRYSSDFADWKPNLDLLLKGSAYPPGGPDIACAVRFAVGEWSKTLRVVGPRTFRPGLLFGGRATDPEPFSRMPLSWENAYGGPDYALNPVGRGHGSPELPTIEDPKRPVTKQGERRVTPVGFGPISPQWPQRIGKRGKKYGASYRRERFPFFSEDFDWTYFNAAPADQQLTEFLRGDEELVFENLHPSEPVFKCRLPGLRIRAFVRGRDDEVREPAMVLDTLLADLDAGRLYLTWRGLTPIEQIDMTDVQSALIVSEPTDTKPKPQQVYIDQLEAFEADPVGLNDKFPPGFLEVGLAIEAAELAEMKGEEPPVDLMKLSKNLPAGCPFPPWFLTAAAGAPDPLGIGEKFPPGTLEAAARGDEDPMGIMKRFPPGFPTKAEAEDMLEGLEKAKATKDPEAVLDELGKFERLVAEDKRPDFREKLAEAKQQLKKAQETEHDGEKPYAKALAATQDAPPAETTPADDVAKAVQKAQDDLNAIDTPGAEEPAAKGLAKLAAVPSLDQAVAEVLKPLEAFEVPEVPEYPDPSERLTAAREQLIADEAKLRERGIDHPLLGLFKVGGRMIDEVSTIVVRPPDLSRLIGGLEKLKGGLLGAGISLAALGALTGLIGRVQAAQDKLPPQPPGPARTEFAYGELREHDFSGQDLQGANFARAVLTKANFKGANLTGADFTEATLTWADFTGAKLNGATLKEVDAANATFSGTDLSGADLSAAELSRANFAGSDLSKANLLRATLKEATLSGAKLREASLIEAKLDKTDLSQADLGGASLESAKGERTNLRGANLEAANLQFASLDKADLDEANLRGADLSLAKLDKIRADGANFDETTLKMTKVTKSLLRGASLRGAKSMMASFVGSDLSQADLRGCQFEATNLSETILDGANFDEAFLDRVDLRDAQANGARFVKARMPNCAAGGKARFTGSLFVSVEAPGSLWQDTDLSGCDFSHANLQNTLFQGAYGEDVSFFAARLKGASFCRAKLAKTRFFAADLCHADLTRATLLDAQFTRANCYNAKFLWAILGGCDFLEANLDAAVFDEDYRPIGRA